jgi:Fic family protein
MPIQRRKTYPDSPGFEKDSDTSKAAAISFEDVQGSFQDQALIHIAGTGPRGLTSDELERMTGWRHQTASARIRELVLKGFVVDSGRRRQTSSGHKAAIWVTMNNKEK